MKLNPFDPRNWTAFIAATLISLYMYAVPPASIPLLGEGMVQFFRASLIMLALYLLFQKIFTMELHWKIMIAMILGALAGIVFRDSVAELKPIGDAFIRLIRMIVVPLVLASLIAGTASLKDVAKMKRIGGKTLIYYLSSTAIAITVGLILANIIQPGTGIEESVRNELLADYGGIATEKISSAQENRPGVVDTFLNMIPNNPFEALGLASMLQVIFFSIFTGIALTLIPGDKAKPVIDFFDGIFEAMIKIVLLVIEIAPYGVFALLADVAGSLGLDILFLLLKYTLTVALGLVIMVLVYPFVVKLLSGMQYGRFLKGIRPAQLIAFSTSSSGATLPVTMEVCEENLGVSNEITSFVLPLGATVNMDGTALYQGVAAVFIAQVFGIPLDLGAQLTIVLTATLASIGTAAAPGVGIIMLVIVLEQIGLPLEGIGMILAVDRILDMMRTVVNITSDATAATIIAASEGQLRPQGAVGAGH